MRDQAGREYWYARLAVERSLAAIYLIAFLVAANQFVPLLGDHGLLPVPLFIRDVPFSASPSLFFFAATDRTFVVAWTGVIVSGLAIAGLPQRLGTTASAVAWFLLWVLYLSFVNVGQTFYAFGWESLGSRFRMRSAGSSTGCPRGPSRGCDRQSRRRARRAGPRNIPGFRRSSTSCSRATTRRWV